MENFKAEEVKIVDLKKCGDIKRIIEEAINEEIKIWMNVKNVSISDDRKTATIIYKVDLSSYEKIIARAADLKLNQNIPC